MLVKLFKKTIILLLSLLLLYGCAEETAPVSTPKKANIAKKKAVVASKPKPAGNEKKEVEKIPPVYSYDPSGKMDPFYPFLAEVAIQSDEGVDKADLVPLTELEKYALTQFKVVAVMAVGKKKVAMVEDPQGMGHSVFIGVLIGQNKGRVVNIQDGVIYVEEKSRDMMGELKSSIIEMAIETPEGGIK